VPNQYNITHIYILKVVYIYIMLNKYIVKIVCIQGIFYRKGAFTAGDGELINDVKVTNDIGIPKYIYKYNR